MTTTLSLGQVTGSDDADCRQSGTSNYSNSRTYVDLTQHTGGTTLATVGGFRFFIPNTVVSADITDVKLRLVSVNTGTGLTNMAVLIERAANPTTWDGTTNLPSTRYTSAAGTATPVTWTTGSLTANTMAESPSLTAADLKAAIDANASHATNGTTVAVYCKPTILTAPVAFQAYSQDHPTAGNRPVLRVTVSTAPTYEAITALDVSYADGTGITTSQQCDIYVPAGAPDDVGGRRFVVWLHGGFWRTGVASKAALYTPFRDFCLDHGFVFINMEYNKVQSDILFADNTGPSHPYPVLDVRTLMKFLAANAADYRIDITRGFITGESAGAHVALEAFVTQGDTGTYTGYQNQQGNRGSMPARTAPVYDFNRGLTTQAFKGVFTWVAPVDMTVATSNPNELNAAAVHLGRTGYMGGKQGVNPSTTTGNTDELDINRYITGTGRCYTTAHTPTGPIGFCYGTADDIVIQASSVDAIYNALPTYDRPTEGTISTSTTGLSRYPAQGKTHTNTMRDEGSWTFFLNWMNTIDPPTPQPVQAGPRVPSRPSVPSVPTVG